MESCRGQMQLIKEGACQVEKQKITKKEKHLFSRKRNFYLLAAGLVCLFLAVLVFAYLYAADAFKPTPEVSVRADNCYEETLYVVTDIDYAPFSYLNEYGENTGMDVELMNEVANRLHMNLELELMDWTEANRRFRDGEADIILNMETDLVAKDAGMIATIPTVEKQYVVYGREKISSVAELYGRRVASLHQMPELGLDRDITYIDSYEAIFKALRDGEYDFAICPIQVGNTMLEKLDIRDVHQSYAVSHVYGAMALSADKEDLRDRINVVLKDLWQEGFMERMDSKWITHHYVNMTVTGMLESHPWLGTSVLMVLLLVIFLFVSMVIQHRNALAKDAYAAHLREDLETIERQRADLEKKQAELIEAKQRAEEGSRAKTTFLSNMSHDIRTPMNAIIGYTNLARRDDMEPEQVRSYLDKIANSSQHLLALINDILEMSRIESGKLELEEAEADVCEMMAEVRDLFSAQMEAKGIRYTVDAEGVGDSRVFCDKNRLNRVLLNLISNACKFTPDGGSVSVSLTQVNGGERAAGVQGENDVDSAAGAQHENDDGYAAYELRVKDNGIGMTEEFAGKVFEAFERERTSTISGIQGTGLGMAITKRILDLMNGTIDVITAPGMGTEFVVRLKLKLQSEAVLLEAAETETSASEEPGKKEAETEAAGTGMPEGERSEGGAGEADTSASGQQSMGARGLETAEADDGRKASSQDSEAEPDFSGMRLLLVEDIEINREIAAMILEEMGFLLDIAVNGKEAVDQVAASKPGYYDAVLMDIQMPVMNGYEAAMAIRALDDSRLANVPIIAMTANAFAEDVQAAREAGMNGHVAKPIDIRKLEETLADILCEGSAQAMGAGT